MSGILFEGGDRWWPTDLNQDEIFVTATQNYIGNATSLTVPDLSGVSGFLTPPGSGTSVGWVEQMNQGTYPSYGSPAGTAFTFVQVGGTYMMP
jgi:hypothetical protein